MSAGIIFPERIAFWSRVVAHGGCCRDDMTAMVHFSCFVRLLPRRRTRNFFGASRLEQFLARHNNYQVSASLIGLDRVPVPGSVRYPYSTKVLGKSSYVLEGKEANPYP
jgi:hypothetical protein